MKPQNCLSEVSYRTPKVPPSRWLEDICPLNFFPLDKFPDGQMDKNSMGKSSIGKGSMGKCPDGQMPALMGKCLP